MSGNKICDLRRLPLGRPDFSDLRERNKIYVDKTKLIAQIAEEDVPIFFARPRRFGKSLLINTFHSLFAKGLEDFQGLEMEKTWQDKTYQVIHIDFSEIAESIDQEFNYSLSTKIINEFNIGYKIPDNSQKLQYPNIIISEILKNFNNNSIVLLIDEYDAPLTHHIDEPNDLKSIMKTLNNFYATIKQYTGKFRFIFITGVTRASHVSIFSAFNNLKDLSLRKEFNTILGFTKDDLEYYFDPYVENAANILKLSKNEVYTRLEQYYDGFQFSIEAKQTLYNPWSILNFLDSPTEGFYNYWFKSGGSSSIIMNYLKIKDNFDILSYKNREIYKTIDELSNRYEITNIPIEILLFQAGYFTIRQGSNNRAHLVFPNTEVEDSILSLYLTANNIRVSNEVDDRIDDLAQNIDQKNLVAIVDTFNATLNDCVSSLSQAFQDERSIRDIIYANLPQNLDLQKIKERETVKGRSDLELLTRHTHMVIEFKRTKGNRDAKASLEEAIEQIKARNYGISSFKTKILYRVAMVISTEEKKILLDFCKEVD